MSGHFLNESESKAQLPRSYEKVLTEPVPLLEANAQALVDKWVNLYLSAFGRKSFFSPDRVQKIFSEMAELFLQSVRNSHFDSYFEALKEKGRFFSELGVPFEEVILCLQLFEEAYLAIILQDPKALKHKVEEIVLAFEEFSNRSTAIFAVSYFRTSKREWLNAARGHEEENERLKRELASLHEEFFTSTKNELASMELMISGINSKLRKTVVQSRRVQLFSELLEKESNFKSLLRIADKFLKQAMPPGSDAVFGVFDENQRKVTLYSTLDSGDEEHEAPPVLDEIFFSQLPLEYQEALFSESKATIVFQDARRLPRFLQPHSGLKSRREFLFLPLKKYHDAMGFLFLASSEKEIFSKLLLKYYQRLGRVFASALFSQVYFDRYKKHSEFTSIMDQLEERVLQRNPLESTVDFCLGSMIDLLDVERASLMLLDRHKKTLSIYAAKGYKVYPFSGLVLKWGEGIAGWSVKESKIISIPRMKNERMKTFFDKIVRTPNDPPHLHVKSLLCVPLMRENEPIGVVNLSTLSYYRNFEQ